MKTTKVKKQKKDQIFAVLYASGEFVGVMRAFT
jgi:hypothetical protein